MKNRKLNWAIGILMFIGLALPAIYLAVDYYHESQYELDEYRNWLSDNLYSVYNDDLKYEVHSSETDEVVGAYDFCYSIYNYIVDQDLSLIEVVNDGISSFIDATTGAVVDSLGTYNYVGDPNSDTGYVEVRDNDNMLGFINVFTGEKITTTINNDNDYSYGYLSGYFTANSEYKGATLHSKSGDTILSIPKGKIIIYNVDGDILFVVNSIDSVNVLDENMKELLPAGYALRYSDNDNLYLYKEGDFYTYDITTRTLNKKSQIDSLTEVYEEVEKTFNEYDDVISTTKRLTEYYINEFEEDYYGVVDSDLNMLIPAIYSSVKYMGNGVFECFAPNGDYDKTDYINVKK